MLDLNSKVVEIEKKYNVQNLKFNELSIWSFLRKSYQLEEEKGLILTSNQVHVNYDNIPLTKKIANIFFGFRGWFNKYDYICFFNIKKKIVLGNEYLEIPLSNLISKLDSNSILYVDQHPRHYPKESSGLRKCSSLSFLLLIKVIYTFFYKIISPRVNFESKLLSQINDTYKIQVDYREAVSNFIIESKFYYFYLKIYSPRGIFFQDYSINQPLIYAAKKLSIKTVEISHGIIYQEMPQYFFQKKLNSDFFPNCICVYTKNEKKMLDSSINNNYDAVELIQREFLPFLKGIQKTSEANNILFGYRNTISVSTQFPVEDEVALFIKKCALIDDSIGWFISIRHFRSSYYDKFNFPSNIYIVNNCYDYMINTNIHASVYSTCIAEANYIGKKVILINIHNLSKKYLGKYENNLDIFIANTPSEFIEYVDTESFHTKSFYNCNHENNNFFLD